MILSVKIFTILGSFTVIKLSSHEELSSCHTPTSLLACLQHSLLFDELFEQEINSSEQEIENDQRNLIIFVFKYNKYIIFY